MRQRARIKLPIARLARGSIERGLGVARTGAFNMSQARPPPGVSGVAVPLARCALARFRRAHNCARYTPGVIGRSHAHSGAGLTGMGDRAAQNCTPAEKPTGLSASFKRQSSASFRSGAIVQDRAAPNDTRRGSFKGSPLN